MLKAPLVIVLGLMMVGQVHGQHRHGRKPPSSAATAKQEVSVVAEREVIIDGRRLTIPDVMVKDQSGKKARFYTDLLKGKSFVLGFFFTDCTYVCRRQGALFSAVQKQLGKRLGKDTFIISVTVNPQRDTVERLNAWGAKYKRKPGWTLVTGSVTEMEKLVKAFTGEGAGPRDIHSGLVFIANDVTGEWTYVDELTSAAEVERRLNEVGPVVPKK